MKLSSIRSLEEFYSHSSSDAWSEAARAVCQRHSITFQTLKRAALGDNIVFFVDERLIIKIFTPFLQGFKREKAALEFVQRKTSLPVPEIFFAGEIEGFDYLVMTQMQGVLMMRELWLTLDARQQIEIISELAEGLKQLHSNEAAPIDFDWQKFVEHQTATVFERQRAGGASQEWLERLPSYLEETLPLLPQNFAQAFVHGDVHFGNLRLTEADGRWRISGLFDFADSLKGFYEYDFVAIGVLMMQGQAEIQREFFRAYGYRDSEIDAALRKRLMLLTILYECSNLRKYALRLRPEAVEYTLDELERAIWSFAGEEEG